MTIQREEFGIPITAEDQPDLMDTAGFFRSGAGNFWVSLAHRIGSVDHMQAVHRCYEKHGFEAVAQDDMPEDFPLAHVDAKFFRLTL